MDYETGIRLDRLEQLYNALVQELIDKKVLESEETKKRKRTV